MIQHSEKTCPKCGSAKLKSWHELTDDQKMLVKSLPASAEYPFQMRKNHRFCTKCWFETSDNDSSRVV